MKIYRHYKNGKHYEIVDYCMIQEGGYWVHAIIYIELAGKVKFVRSLSEFFNKFDLVGNE